MPIKRLNIATDLHDTLGRFDIRQYGAVVDGVTDDTVALGLAIAAAKDSNGGIIYFPAGTTRISTGFSATVDFDSEQQGMLIFQGEGSRSRISVGPLTSGNFLVSVGNLSEFLWRDLLVHGQSSGGLSSGTMETTTYLFNVGSTWNVLFKDSFFIGLGTSGVTGHGLFFLSGRYVKFENVFFGGCTSLAQGMIDLFQVSQYVFDFVSVIDFHAFDGVSYNKGGAAGVVHSWIKSRNPIAVSSADQSIAGVIKNSRFDEQTTNALIDLTGTAERTALFENVTLNGGFSGLPCVKLNTFNKAVFRDVWAGINPPGPWSSLLATDVAQVEVDGLIHAGGASDIQMLGSTKRLKLRNSQAVVITNTAGSFIDADQAMPTTASAAALVPKGKVTHVTGTTTITSITSTNFRPGDAISLVFDDALTVTDGDNLNLAGTFVTTAGDTLKLEYDGTNWNEMSRSNN